MGITWLLLLHLSLSFHRVSSQDATSGTTSAATLKSLVATEKSSTDKAATLGGTVVAPPTPAGTTAGHSTNAPTAAPTSSGTTNPAQPTYTASAAPTTVAMVTAPPATTRPSHVSKVVVTHHSTSPPAASTTGAQTAASSKQPALPVMTPSDPSVSKTSAATEQPTTQSPIAAGTTDKVELELESGSVTTTPTITESHGPSSTASAPTQVILTTTAAVMSPRVNIVMETTASIHTGAQLETFTFSLHGKYEEKREFAEVCKRLMVNMEAGSCILKWQNGNKIHFDSVEITGTVKTALANQHYEELTKKATDNKTLIAILASCGALLIMIIILAVCASHHRKPYETQQHLTEELHTVENGYHDNPTLEVMEVQPEMQEKKMVLNGEFNDSWIVPIDNLLKDMPDEEDTHL